MRKMRWSSFFILCVVIGGMGCGSKKDICNSKQCPNDAAVTQAQIDQCKSGSSSSKCSGEFVDLGSCILDNSTCKADGTTDPEATLAKFSANCIDQANKLSACCKVDPTVPACQ